MYRNSPGMIPSALNNFTVVTVPNVTSVSNVTPTRNVPKITNKFARNVPKYCVD